MDKVVKSIINNNIREHLKVISNLDNELLNGIELLGNEIAETLKNSGTIFWCGNGGSSSDSQHLAAELIGRYKKDRAPLKSIALTADSSVLTCIGNDYSFDSIFSRQLEALARNGDLVILITTSGNSQNIIEAANFLKNAGIKTFGLLGNDGGIVKNLLTDYILVPSCSTARVQEVHILIGHILCEIIESKLGLN